MNSLRTEAGDGGEPIRLPFSNREHAGRLLAARLRRRAWADPVVLALPRGGVPVAAQVAEALNAPLDLLLVRKIGTEYQSELALAAVVEGPPPHVVIDEPVQAMVHATPQWLEAAVQRELQEIARRREVYLRNRPAVPVSGRTVIIVDDGIATGTTVRAALAGLRQRGAAHLVLAVPVAPRDTAARLSREVDELICLAQPEPFEAIGRHYEDFHQLDDAEVIAQLDEAALRREASGGDERGAPSA